MGEGAGVLLLEELEHAKVSTFYFDLSHSLLLICNAFSYLLLEHGLPLENFHNDVK